MLKKALVVLLIVFAGFLTLVALQPSSYRVERSKEMAAPGSVVFAVLSDFRHFGAWSPWAELDANIEQTVTGTGKGSTYEWSGNDDVGSGRMEITELVPESKIVQSLEFKEPFASSAVTGFDVEQAGDKTKVTWWMEGQNGFAAKAFGLFVDMGDMIGKDFDKGLGKLAVLAEKEAAKAASAPAPEVAATEALPASP